MRDAYIRATLGWLRFSERGAARSHLHERFASSADDLATILDLGHPYSSALPFMTDARALIKAQDRYWHRRLFFWALMVSAITLISWLVILPFFRPVRITVSFVLWRTALALAVAGALSMTAVTALVLLLASLNVSLPPPRWDEHTARRLLGQDDLAFGLASLLSRLIGAVVQIAVLLLALIFPEAIALFGRPVFGPSLRLYLVPWFASVMCSLALLRPLWTKRMWTRRLFLADSLIEALTTLYSVWVLTRWTLWQSAFVSIIGEVRLKIIVTALSVLWVLLTLIERLGDGYTVFSGTAPVKGSEATPR